MEGLLDLYALPYNEAEPIVCLDEHPFQMVSETRKALPPKAGQVERFDYEYKREGTCNLFVFFDPHAAWRHVEVTKTRTRIDFAHCLRMLTDDFYPQAHRIHVVLDNLNVHKISTLYDAFPPEQAALIRSKLVFHHTPVHGSWLNMVEIEIGVLKNQCLDRYLGSIEMVRDESGVWQHDRNQLRATIDWNFTSDKAREKLKRLYPKGFQLPSKSMATPTPSSDSGVLTLPSMTRIVPPHNTPQGWDNAPRIIHSPYPRAGPLAQARHPSVSMT